MKLDTRTVAAVPSLGLVKMEDRKRPVMADSEDAAPPAKRQATVNGAKPVSDDADSHLKELEVRCLQPRTIPSPHAFRSVSADTYVILVVSEGCHPAADEGVQAGEGGAGGTGRRDGEEDGIP